MKYHKRDLLKLQEEIKILKDEIKVYKNNEKLFHSLMEASVGDIGLDFFNNIVYKLSDWLNAECVIIGQVIDNHKVEAMPMLLDGKIIHGYSYELLGTPCELTSTKGYCKYSENVREFFPQDKELTDISAEGYVGAALYNKNGELFGVLCAISRNKLQLPPHTEDIMKIVGSRITAEIERKKIQQKLVLSEANLIESNISKNKFFSIIAHDLKSPFSALIGFSELLLKEAESNNFTNIKRYAHAINIVSNQTLGLLQNLLDWSMAVTGKLSYSLEEFDLNKLIKEEINFLSIYAQKKDIFLSMVADSEMIISADNNMVRTILRNLISNAIKYTPNGGKISVNADIENSHINVSVSDTGIGIDQCNLDKLFKIGNTFSLKGTNNESGTGLGLILCKEFIELHEGKIWVESEIGKGSVFYITLPKK